MNKLLILAALVATASAACSVYSVTGAGTAAVNGMYALSRWSAGARAWTKTDGMGGLSLSRYTFPSGNTYWYLSDDANTNSAWDDIDYYRVITTTASSYPDGLVFMATTGALPLPSVMCNNSIAADAYFWDFSAWGACSVACGTGTRTRTVTCTNTQGQVAANSMCDAATMPAASMACNPMACTDLSSNGISLTFFNNSLNCGSASASCACQCCFNNDFSSCDLSTPVGAGPIPAVAMNTCNSGTCSAAVCQSTFSTSCTSSAAGTTLAQCYAGQNTARMAASSLTCLTYTLASGMSMSFSGMCTAGGAWTVRSYVGSSCLNGDLPDETYMGTSGETCTLSKGAPFSVSVMCENNSNPNGASASTASFFVALFAIVAAFVARV